MTIPLAAKVLGGIAIAGSVIAIGISAAHADEKKPGDPKKPSKPGTKPNPADKALPADLQQKVAAALASADPVQMHEVADELEHEGFKDQAKALDLAADAIANAEDAVQPTPPIPVPVPVPNPGGGGGVAPVPVPVPVPVPQPGGGGVLPGPLPIPPGPITPPVPVPVVQQALVYHVKAGQGPFQAAQTILGTSAGAARFHELQHANIPFDADGIKREDNHAGGLKPGLNPGDRLLVPPTWAEIAKPGTVTLERVGVPQGALHGDGDVTDDTVLRRLAGRVATEVLHTAKGSENKDLIATYQRCEFARGRRTGDCLGLYDTETALNLLAIHGICPPLRFADGAEIYYPPNPLEAKRVLYSALSRLAGADVVRREEFMQAIAQLGDVGIAA
jgi:hypothetical protein